MKFFILCKVINIIIFITISLSPIIGYSSPIDQLQNNHLITNKFIVDDEKNLYLLYKNNLYYKSNALGDIWGSKARDIKTVAIDPKNKKTLYIITNKNSVLKSIDSGKKYTTINNGLPKVNLSCIFINPHNNQEVFLGTAEGLYRTKDAGLSWKQTTLKGRIKQFLANPKNNSIYYAVTKDGLFSSKDAGHTWKSIDNTLPKILIKGKGRTAKKIPLEVVSIAYANYTKPFLLSFTVDRTKNLIKIYKSENNGISWSEAKVIFDEKNELSSVYISDFEIFLGANNSIYKSNDGINWKKIELSKSKSSERITGISKLKDNKGLIITTSKDKILKLDNDGNLIGSKSAVDNIPEDLIDEEALYTIYNGEVNSWDVSPDGKYFVTTSEKRNDDKTRVYEVGSWEQIAALEGRGSVDFSPDGKYLATGNKTVYIYEVGSWKHLTKIKNSSRPTYSIQTIVFSPDSNYLTTGDGYGYGNGHLRIYEVGSWKKLAEKVWNANHVNRINFSPDSRYVAVRNRDTNSSSDDAIYIIEVGSWKELTNMKREYNFAFSNDSHYFITGTWKKYNARNGARIYETDSWKELNFFDLNKVYTVDFSDNDNFVFIGGINAAYVFKVGTWSIVNKLKHDQAVHSVSFDRNGSSLITISESDKYYATSFFKSGTWMKFKRLDNLWGSVFDKLNGKWIIGEKKLARNKKQVVAIDTSRYAEYYLIKNLRNLGFKEQADALTSASQKIENSFINNMCIIPRS